MEVRLWISTFKIDFKFDSLGNPIAVPLIVVIDQSQTPLSTLKLKNDSILTTVDTKSHTIYVTCYASNQYGSIHHTKIVPTIRKYSQT